MNSNSVKRILIAILFVVLVGGCIPTSVNPLSAPHEQEMDTSILGTYRGVEEDEFLHIGINKDTKLLRIIMVETDSQGVLKFEETLGHTTMAGGNSYLNWTGMEDNGETGEYVIIKYSADEEYLSVSLMDNFAAASAINNGAIAGTVKKGEYFEDVLISEEPAKLRQFVIDNDSALFKKKETAKYKRL